MPLASKLKAPASARAWYSRMGKKGGAVMTPERLARLRRLQPDVVAAAARAHAARKAAKASLTTNPTNP